MLIVKFNILLFLLEYLSKTIFISFGNNLEQSEKQVYDRNPFIGYGNRMMESKKQEAARTIGRLKNKTTDQERLQGWREACGKQHLSGEFALSTKLNGEAYTEEEARMVAELFGR